MAPVVASSAPGYRDADPLRSALRTVAENVLQPGVPSWVPHIIGAPQNVYFLPSKRKERTSKGNVNSSYRPSHWNCPDLGLMPGPQCGKGGRWRVGVWGKEAEREVVGRGRGKERKRWGGRSTKMAPSPNAPQTKKQPGPDARFSFSSRVEMKLGPSDLGHQGKAAKGLQGRANQHSTQFMQLLGLGKISLGHQGSLRVRALPATPPLMKGPWKPPLSSPEAAASPLPDFSLRPALL